MPFVFFLFKVGYKVRLEGMKGRDTRLLFCTTGVLLRRLLVDRNLKGVSHIIVDEIHERGMNEGSCITLFFRCWVLFYQIYTYHWFHFSDFLLVVLKDLLPRRPELKLILMSATLNAELFSSYFGGAPTIHIPVSSGDSFLTILKIISLLLSCLVKLLYFSCEYFFTCNFIMNLSMSGDINFLWTC